MSTILDRIAQLLSPTAIGKSIAAFLPKLIVALLVLLVFYLVWKGADRALRALQDRLDPTIHSFLRSIGKFTLLTIALVTALSELGINVGSLIAGLGIAGLTLGFAARDALSNIISGLFIFWDRPFVVGDLIEISGQYGRVTDITLRSTRVVTVDGKMLAIPNSATVNSTVASYTNFPNLRLDIKLTVGVNEDLGRIRQTFLALVGEDAAFLSTPEPAMVLADVGDYNLTIECRVWLKDEKEHVAARFALRERLFEAFREAKIDMPLQTIQLAPQLAPVPVELRPKAA